MVTEVNERCVRADTQGTWELEVLRSASASARILRRETLKPLGWALGHLTTDEVQSHAQFPRRIFWT